MFTLNCKHREGRGIRGGVGGEGGGQLRHSEKCFSISGARRSMQIVEAEVVLSILYSFCFRTRTSDNILATDKVVPACHGKCLEMRALTAEIVAVVVVVGAAVATAASDKDTNQLTTATQPQQSCQTEVDRPTCLSTKMF